MSLSNELISQFVKITQEENESTTLPTIQGTVHGSVFANGRIYIQLDGSETLTPATTTMSVKDGDRVLVAIEDHNAIVLGNISDPSASGNAVSDLDDKITRFDTIIAKKVDTDVLEAEIARIDSLTADNVTINEKLTAAEADIDTLEANNVTINEKLEATEANIEKIETEKLDADVAEIKYAHIDDVEAIDAHIYNLEATYGEFKVLTTNRFDAIDANIEDLEAKKLNVDEAEVKYANIDFSNIGEAAITKIFSESGIIKDLVVSEGTITGELVGVTIKGDLIEGNTIVADKLVVKGEDGLYYKLNTDGVTTETEQTDYNSLNGTVIQAKSITAEKIAVTDLVAFGATIAGFHIGDNAIYSDVKSSATNTTRGIYMDKSGQLSVGDANNYLRYYKDQNGDYKLEISASSMSIKAGSTSTTVEDAINDIKNEMSTIKDEVTTLLRIESSRGTVFKNDQVSTVLSAVIYRGNTIIRDIDTLHSILGSSAYLEWSWQHLNDEDYGVISADDGRIGNGGFTFTLSPDDVNTKVTFMCTLNT